MRTDSTGNIKWKSDNDEGRVRFRWPGESRLRDANLVNNGVTEFDDIEQKFLEFNCMSCQC